MTTPTPSPEPAKRSKRIYVCWGAAFTLLLALGFFCWHVVRPLLEVRAAVIRCAAEIEPVPEEQYGTYSEIAPKEVELLGGPERAAKRLGAYLALPRWITTHRRVATIVLGFHCDERAIPELEELLEDGDWRIRAAAVGALKNMAMRHRRAVVSLPKMLEDPRPEVRLAAVAPYRKPCYETEAAILSLGKLLQDDHKGIRRYAADELSRLGAKAGPVVPNLTKALNDPDPKVRRSVTRALKKIKGFCQVNCVNGRS